MDTNLNPLSMDLLDIKVGIPMLAKGVYNLVITKAEVQDLKGGKTGKLVYVELKNADPAKTPDGDDLAPMATTIFHRINMQPSGKATWEMVLRSVASVVQAARLGTGCTLNNTHEWVPRLNGQNVVAAVEVEPGGTNPLTSKSYGPKNVITYFVTKR